MFSNQETQRVNFFNGSFKGSQLLYFIKSFEEEELSNQKLKGFKLISRFVKTDRGWEELNQLTSNLKGGRMSLCQSLDDNNMYWMNASNYYAFNNARNHTSKKNTDLSPLEALFK